MRKEMSRVPFGLRDPAPPHKCHHLRDPTCVLVLLCVRSLFLFLSVCVCLFVFLSLRCSHMYDVVRVLPNVHAFVWDLLQEWARMGCSQVWYHSITEQPCSFVFGSCRLARTHQLERQMEGAAEHQRPFRSEGG